MSPELVSRFVLAVNKVMRTMTELQTYVKEKTIMPFSVYRQGKASLEKFLDIVTADMQHATVHLEDYRRAYDQVRKTICANALTPS